MSKLDTIWFNCLLTGKTLFANLLLLCIYIIIFILIYIYIGTIPTELGLLTQMEMFGLVETFLTGMFGMIMSLDTHFIYLLMFILDGIIVTCLSVYIGTIPTAFASWTKLESLSINHNPLDGKMMSFCILYFTLVSCY